MMIPATVLSNALCSPPQDLRPKTVRDIRNFPLANFRLPYHGLRHVDSIAKLIEMNILTLRFFLGARFIKPLLLCIEITRCSDCGIFWPGCECYVLCRSQLICFTTNKYSVTAVRSSTAIYTATRCYQHNVHNVPKRGHRRLKCLSLVHKTPVCVLQNFTHYDRFF